jgi:hypothetical protein
VGGGGVGGLELVVTGAVCGLSGGGVSIVSTSVGVEAALWLVCVAAGGVGEEANLGVW